MEPPLSLEGIAQIFSNVVALEGIDFELRRGEVHAVRGENGGGKSTLMKIIRGQYQPDAGSLRYKGQDTRFTTIDAAQKQGIVMIHQELNLVPHLSVAENIYLAREPTRGWFV